MKGKQGLQTVIDAKSSVRRYAVAVLMVIAAASLRVALVPVMGTTSPYITFYLGIVIAAAVGGMGPGLLVTLAGAGVGLMVILPKGTIAIQLELVRLSIFLLSGIGISLIAEAMHRHRRREREQSRELEKAVEQMMEAKAAAEEANRAKSEFLAKMSHEIRTPMTVVIGSIDHLLQTGPSPEQRPLLEMAETAAQRLLAIINDVLDISKIEARQVKIEAKPFDLRECVAKAVDIFALSAREKGVRLHWQVAEHLPLRVEGDPDRLAQILVNLVGNAVKFTEQGEVAVHVAEGKEGIVFTVRDTGIGIPGAMLGEIFEPFNQGDPSRTRRYGGTGLGLSISKELVELMGGSIRVESDEGRGSTFTFEIPFKPLPRFNSG